MACKIESYDTRENDLPSPTFRGFRRKCFLHAPMTHRKQAVWRMCCCLVNRANHGQLEAHKQVDQAGLGLPNGPQNVRWEVLRNYPKNEAIDNSGSIFFDVSKCRVFKGARYRLDISNRDYRRLFGRLSHRADASDRIRRVAWGALPATRFIEIVAVILS